jgi:shikimate kinase
MDILEIFSVKGEPVFRSAEVDVSRRLAQFPLLVVASGGGWAANRPAVAHLRPISRIIYLRVSPKEALRRMGVEIAGRPLFATGHPEEVMQRLYETRRMVYEEVADIIVDADASGMDELVTMIAKLL